MSYVIEGSTGPWEVVVGLEVHAQVISKSKLFSGAATEYGAEPNSQVSFVDAAFPGMLPVPNRECVAQAVRTGLGLDAQINLVSRFDRKNYFYADLPAGYQISQFEHPIVGAGVVDVELADGSSKRIGVTRLHLEQDAGKSLHDQHATKSYIDLNRSGVALMEIVSEPDMRSPEEAGAYLPVHDLPPDRDEAALKPKEQEKIETELRAARDRQATSAAAPNPAAK